MTQQHNSGRRRASVPVDASPAHRMPGHSVDTVLNGEGTSRRPGRRVLGAVPASAENTATSQQPGRRFEASLRYGASPDSPSLAGPEIPAAPLAPVVAAGAAPRGRRPRLGLVYKLTAVAAVSGLAFAAAPAPEGGDVVAEPQRVAQIAVADVKAPAKDKVAVKRASMTSEYVKKVKAPKPAPVTTAAAGKAAKTAKAAKPAPVTTANPGKAAKKAKPAPAPAADTGKVTRLSQPVDSIRLTSRFGFRKNPTGPGYMNHNGLDYAVPTGTPIKASAAGTVVQAEWAGHSGFRVKVDHGNGLETSYNHNSALKVSVGQKVARGEVVALAGSTGNSTGPHLHLEVIVNGKWVNPQSWL